MLNTNENERIAEIHRVGKSTGTGVFQNLKYCKLGNCVDFNKE